MCLCLLAVQCPDGIDFYFDTVGGELLDEVLKRIRRNGRVVVCGASSQYNGNLNTGLVRGPSEYLKLAEKGAQMIGCNVMRSTSTACPLPCCTSSGLYVPQKALHDRAD
jgi:NADPH-dependent curcumin reductase CurA